MLFGGFPSGSVREGNGNPLQCSCLENPRDGGAWWAAVYGVVQSQTRLKRLSSSSSYGSDGEESVCNVGDLHSVPGSGRSPGGGNGGGNSHSNILAWRTPWAEMPGRLQSMGSKRV